MFSFTMISLSLSRCSTISAHGIMAFSTCVPNDLVLHFFLECHLSCLLPWSL
jgi:hypothetical protein